MVQQFKQQAAAGNQREQQLRQWESEILQASQVEEQRWADLIKQLESKVSR